MQPSSSRSQPITALKRAARFGIAICGAAALVVAGAALGGLARYVYLSLDHAPRSNGEAAMHTFASLLNYTLVAVAAGAFLAALSVAVVGCIWASEDVA